MPGTRLEPASPSLDTERLRELLARLAEVLEREPPQLSEAHFRLRGLLLELRRRGHGETDRVAGLAALTPWIELTGIQVQRMYEVLPGSLDPTGA